jgi:uncharacterized membrane protein
MYLQDFKIQQVSLFAQVFLYIFAGANHLIFPEYYLRIMPPYLPYPLELVYFTGILEILFGVGLWFEPTRKITIYLLMVFLLAILPAHWYVIQEGGRPMNMPFWVSVIRFPLQFALMYWAYSLRKTLTESQEKHINAD